MKAVVLGLVTWLFLGQVVWAAPPDASTEFLNERHNDIVLGPPNAPVTLVAYVEYHFMSKRAVEPLLLKIRGTWRNDVRIVVRDYPMDYHVGTALAAQAAHGVFMLKGENAYLLFVEEITPYRGTRDAAYLAAAAERAGAGPAQRFEALLTQGLWEAPVKQSLEEVKAARIAGTPHWYVNGTSIPVGVEIDKVLSAIEQAVKASQASAGEKRGEEVPAVNPEEVPAFNPGKGIGPFFLGQTAAEVKRLGLRSAQRSGGWLCVAAEAGSDWCTYDLQMKEGAVVRIHYNLNRSMVGLKVGSEVFQRDRPALLGDLRARLGCGKTEYDEGGSETPCPSPAKDVIIRLLQGQESFCSDFVRIGRRLPCTDLTKKVQVTMTVAVERP